MSVRGCCTVSLLYFICTVPTDLLDVLYTDDGYYQRPCLKKKNFLKHKKKHDFWKIYEHSKHTTLVLANMDIWGTTFLAIFMVELHCTAFRTHTVGKSSFTFPQLQ